MDNNFWKNLPHGFICLAPMEDVTDTVFREVVMSVSAPGHLHVVFTEFTSTDGLCDARGYERVAERLKVSGSELALLKNRQIKLVAQIWGNDPDKFIRAAQLIEGMGVFDGIDINMGCPVKKVVKKNTCSALIAQPELAVQLIQATKQATALPVSVKTRIGFNEIDTENWIGHLLNAGPDAITIHGRTRKQQSEGMANWTEIQRAVQLRDQLRLSTQIIGNGDIVSSEQIKTHINKYKVNGLMIGRGIFVNPFLFSGKEDASPEEKRSALLRHIALFELYWRGQKNYNILKRFFKIYTSGFSGAKQLRAALMATNNTEEAFTVLFS